MDGYNLLREVIYVSGINNYRTIYLAGGCFWGMEGYFKRIPGVIKTTVGYANGNSIDTSYRRVKETDHAETIKILYDFSFLSLEEILLHYFRIIDPKSLNRQGNDIGRQYRTGIYYTTDNDLKIIKKIFAYEEKIHGEIVVEVIPLKNFIKAEEYHQDYLTKNPGGYCHINLELAYTSLDETDYKNPSEEEIKENIDEISYRVMRENGTEHPNTSKLNDEHRQGIYVDKLTGEPLFSSSEKFDSGCGWPSFSKPILSKNVNYNRDNSHGMRRTEVRSCGGDNHLGHVFNDGPIEKGGLRYCINGVALRFIPLEKMKEEGYEDYIPLVE